LFTPYGKREVIKATYRLYASLQGERASFFYVSKSEANLFPLISKFIGYNELPPGPIFLTPYLNFSNFLRGKKDPAFKYLTICHILDHSEKKPAVLIGDDTQADLAIFARISEKYTDQIEKVYIRKTRRKMTSEQQLLWNNLIKTGVEQVYYGHDYLTVSKKNNR
jgi:phosphatidate phosphatase APP1